MRRYDILCVFILTKSLEYFIRFCVIQEHPGLKMVLGCLYCIVARLIRQDFHLYSSDRYDNHHIIIPYRAQRNFQLTLGLDVLFCSSPDQYIILLFNQVFTLEM
jgi:hypothetical protein